MSSGTLEMSTSMVWKLHGIFWKGNTSSGAEWLAEKTGLSKFPWHKEGVDGREGQEIRCVSGGAGGWWKPCICESGEERSPVYWETCVGLAK